MPSCHRPTKEFAEGAIASSATSIHNWRNEQRVNGTYDLRQLRGRRKPRSPYLHLISCPSYNPVNNLSYEVRALMQETDAGIYATTLGICRRKTCLSHTASHAQEALSSDQETRRKGDLPKRPAPEHGRGGDPCAHMADSDTGGGRGGCG